jgi:hypothetical protein
MCSERAGIHTSTKKAKYSALEIYLDLDLYPASYMSSSAKHTVDEFGISASHKDYVEGVESRTSSEKGKSEKISTTKGIGAICLTHSTRYTN